jgi:hypothetical protein
MGWQSLGLDGRWRSDAPAGPMDPDWNPFIAAREPLHHSPRSALARARAVCGVAFLAHSVAVGCNKRVVAYPDPHQRILARVMQMAWTSPPTPPLNA